MRKFTFYVSLRLTTDTVSHTPRIGFQVSVIIYAYYPILVCFQSIKKQD